MGRVWSAQTSPLLQPLFVRALNENIPPPPHAQVCSRPRLPAPGSGSPLKGAGSPRGSQLPRRGEPAKSDLFELFSKDPPKEFAALWRAARAHAGATSPAESVRSFGWVFSGETIPCRTGELPPPRRWLPRGGASSPRWGASSPCGEPAPGWGASSPAGEPAPQRGSQPPSGEGWGAVKDRSPGGAGSPVGSQLP